jgi:16S rRNA (cytosine967-C5)-methyltransferase
LTPGAQVAAAIDILSAVETGDRPADDIAADYFRRRRYIGAKDRAHIASHVYAVLRHRAALDWWIAKRGVATEARSRVLASLVLVEGWRSDAILACCDGDRFRPARLSPTEERFIRDLSTHSLRHPEMPRAVANDLPEWLEPYFERALGNGLEREMTALNRPAPTDLRVNLLKADRETARRALAAEAVDTEPTPLSRLGLRLRERVPLGNLAAFKQGLVEVQDESSQIAALLADARPGMRVVDFCAGAGGKTLALAAGMDNHGKLVACEVSQRRLDRAARRLRRAGVTNVERRALTGERDKWVKHHKGGFDRVFADVPCLGTGTWRRNPDAKWRMRPEDLADLVERQQQILRSAARLVRPGGRLVYATCSLLREEDEEQAEAFLAAEPDFSLLPVARAWGETIGGASPGGEDYLRLTPARHGTDGFFVAIFERNALDQRSASFETAPSGPLRMTRSVNARENLPHAEECPSERVSKHA